MSDSHVSRSADDRDPQIESDGDGTLRMFAVVARGLEPAAVHELRQLGASNIFPGVGGVEFTGDRALLYRAHLWLRSVTRVLVKLREFAAQTPEMLYSQVRRVPWETLLTPEMTLAVQANIAGASRVARGELRRAGDSRGGGPQGAGKGRFTRPGGGDNRGPRGKPEAGINHSQYAALKIKDAVVDRMRQEFGSRPNVNREAPDVLINAHFAEGRCSLSLDASGRTLHERGYREAGHQAPLKETLAAGLLLLAEFDGTCPVFDPMCGSGTLVIEAALIAGRRAPGLLRPTFGFQRWRDFDRTLWEAEVEAARAQALAVPPFPLFGSDSDARVMETARAGARRAGVESCVSFSIAKAEEAFPPCTTPGLVITNPPYGERISEQEELAPQYKAWGEQWARHYAAWRIVILSGHATLTRQIPLRLKNKHRVFNGPLSCLLLEFQHKTPREEA